MTTANPLRRVAVASLVGTTVEFYDFYIFGTAVALVFGKAFFPALGPAGGTLASLATFAVGFVARPFGSVLFGHFGDRLGRKKTLVASLLMMGTATFAIGLLPSAATIGVAAPILLVVLRLVQGLAVGGEWAGAALLSAEHAPAGRRGTFAMFPQLGPSLAFVLTSATFLATTLTLSTEDFLSYGWRIPFLISAVLVGIGLYVRLKIEETPAFRRISESGSQSRIPFLEVVRRQPRELLLAAGSITMVFAFFHTGVTYLTSYGTSVLKLPQATVLSVGVLAGLVFAAATAVSAWLSDRLGRKKVIIGATALTLPWALLVFPVVNVATTAAFAVGMSVTLALVGLGYGPVGAHLPELFRTRYRYTGAGLAYGIGGVLGGALTPIVSAWLVGHYGSAASGVYLAVLSVFSLACIVALRETRGIEISDEGAEQRAGGAPGTTAPTGREPVSSS